MCGGGGGEGVRVRNTRQKYWGAINLPSPPYLFSCPRSRFPRSIDKWGTIYVYIYYIPRLIITWLTQGCKQLQRYQRWCHALRYHRDTPLLWSWIRKDNILDKHNNEQCPYAQTEEKLSFIIYNMWYLMHNA